jgi:hypothetical protein
MTSAPAVPAQPRPSVRQSAPVSSVGGLLRWSSIPPDCRQPRIGGPALGPPRSEPPSIPSSGEPQLEQSPYALSRQTENAGRWFDSRRGRRTRSRTARTARRRSPRSPSSAVRVGLKTLACNASTGGLSAGPANARRVGHPDGLHCQRSGWAQDACTRRKLRVGLSAGPTKSTRVGQPMCCIECGSGGLKNADRQREYGWGYVCRYDQLKHESVTRCAASPVVRVGSRRR